MPGWFVTGTGTDVGKTFVTCKLVRHFRKRGERVAAAKPVVTGFDADGVASSDTGLLLAALGLPLTQPHIDRVSPWRFRKPLSPHMAAACEGRAIDFQALVAQGKDTLRTAGGPVFIEGIGGIMVPLDDRHTVLDWMKALDLPLVVVGGSYLGALSHTLTAVAVLRDRGFRIAVVVISESPASPVPFAETVATVRNFASQINVVGLVRGSLDDPAPAGFADLTAALL